MNRSLETIVLQSYAHYIFTNSYSDCQRSDLRGSTAITVNQDDVHYTLEGADYDLNQATADRNCNLSMCIILITMCLLFKMSSFSYYHCDRLIPAFHFLHWRLNFWRDQIKQHTSDKLILNHRGRGSKLSVWLKVYTQHNSRDIFSRRSQFLIGIVALNQFSYCHLGRGKRYICEG